MMNERLLRIFYDGQQLLAEGTVSGSTVTLKARYKVGSRVAVREDGSGTKSYYLQNGHKDVVGLANASGQLVNTYTYDLWGNPQTTLEGVDNPFRYSGEFWDKDTGLQYLRGGTIQVWGGANPEENDGQSSWTRRDGSFLTYVGKVFDGEEVSEFDWSGENNKPARLEAAQKLADLIYDWKQENEEEPIRLVAHSHGGNVSIMTSNILAEKGVTVDTLLTIATPVRGYQLESPVGQHIQVYNDFDQVQVNGGSIWLLSEAKRTFKDAENVKVKIPFKKS